MKVEPIGRNNCKNINKRLLVHGCCADCVLRILEPIGNEEQREVAVFFYNPNIQPRSEYLSRLAAIKKVLKEKQVKLVIPDWRPGEYFGVVNNDKNRCINCWRLRIYRTGDWAKRNGYEQISSSMLTSAYLDGKMIAKIGGETAKKFGLEWKNWAGVGREIKTKGFYKQFFCGCVYSLKERYEEKYGEKEMSGNDNN